MGQCVEAGRAARVPTTYVVNRGDALRGAVELVQEDDLFRAPPPAAWLYARHHESAVPED